MGDMADDFDAMRQHRWEQKQRKHDQVPYVMKRLENSGLKVDKFSEEHYRVWHKDGQRYFDFWPSTGRWRDENGNKEGFRIGPLIRAATLKQ